MVFETIACPQPWIWVEGGKATYGLAHMVGSKGLLWAE